MVLQHQALVQQYLAALDAIKWRKRLSIALSVAFTGFAIEADISGN